jgi:hypothetical protein
LRREAPRQAARLVASAESHQSRGRTMTRYAGRWGEAKADAEEWE